MSLKNVLRTAAIFVVTTSVVLPYNPHIAWAKEKITIMPVDAATDDNDGDTGLSPSTPQPGAQRPPSNSNGNKGNRSNSSSSKSNMSVAQVPEAFSCPLFENRPHAELISAIDSLSKEVNATSECSGTPTAKLIEENGNRLKDSAAAIYKMMSVQDPTQITPGEIDQSMTTAISALSGLGDVLNNNTFLNSKCGRQTMSAGKALIAFNDIVNGLAPYALFAVSMNAALLPALPFVAGGFIVTTGISIFSKMMDQNTLDMNNPDHRKAVLQNTCQYTKVAKKVRFMQLAQSGKIDRITSELEQNIDLYNSNIKNPTGELRSLLAYRESANKSLQRIEQQFNKDKADLLTIETQLGPNADDILVCSMAKELVGWAQDGRSFPTSAFHNLDAATSQGDRSTKLRAVTMTSLHLDSMRRISESAAKAGQDDNALKSCALASRSWLTGLRQAIQTTGSIIKNSRADLEAELSRNAEYRVWKLQYSRIEAEKLTIRRVEKAMQELAKDNSIVDRSELAQSIVLLKSGLFGSKTAWSIGRPPVLAWIEHTKKMHDQAISAFLAGLGVIKKGSYSLTDAGKGKAVTMTKYGYAKIDEKAMDQSYRESQDLSNFNLEQIPMGSRAHEIACQQLEGAWLDWSSAIDHLGAIQFFCDMIDPVLDIKMDSSVISACRGESQLNGNVRAQSIVQMSKATLIKKGYQKESALISQRLKDLQCPMPTISVMNQ